MDEAVGVQSYTYRRFSALGSLEQAQRAGVVAIEVWPGHLGPDAAEAAIASYQQTAQMAGIRVVGYGVIQLGSGAEPALRLAARLGCSYVSVDVEPGDTSAIASGVHLANELGLRLGIHNHGPGHHYSTVDTVLAVLDHQDAALGACVDTGHFLRAGQDPVAAIHALGSRISGVHLKDFLEDDTEVLPGRGRIDLVTVLRALRDVGFNDPVVIEYEADPGNPTPAVRASSTAVHAAMARI